MRCVRTVTLAGSVLAGALLVAAAVTLPLGPSEPPLRSHISPSPSAATSNPLETAAAATMLPATPRPSATVTKPPRPAPKSSPSPAPTLETGVAAGQVAPEFELHTPEGERVRLSDFRGRPVWINFWAPWCPASRTEMPRLEGFYLEHQAEGLVILGIGVRDSADGMRAYADDLGVSYPIVVDGDGAVADSYRALALPVHYWLDRDGIVRDWAFGELPPDVLASSLQLILEPDT